MQMSFELKGGSDRTAWLAYRFDEKPGREVKVRFLNGFRDVVIEDEAELAQFAHELATSERSCTCASAWLTADRAPTEFRLAGAPAAVAAGFGNCPLADDARKAAGGVAGAAVTP